jgi:hypothetical protein
VCAHAQVDQIINERWEFLHSDVYAAAYALDPEYAYAGHDIGDNEEVMAGLSAMLTKMLSKDAVGKALADYSTKFRRFLGSFSGDSVREHARDMPGHVSWDVHGGCAPELQSVAVKLLSQSPSSSPTERNWSDFDYLKNKRRNRLLPDTAEKLVHVYRNSRETARFDAEFDELYVSWNLPESADAV